MNIKDEFTAYIVHDVLRDLDGVSAKRMFGAYGLYLKDVMFGIVHDNTVYFKVDDQSAAEYEAMGSKPFTYKRGGKEITIGYREVPDAVLSDPERVADWAYRAYRIGVDNTD